MHPYITERLVAETSATSAAPHVRPAHLLAVPSRDRATRTDDDRGEERNIAHG